MNRSTPWRITVAVWMVWAAAGCGLEEPGGTDTAAPGPVEPPRIVSLSPALSRTLVDLGLADHVVGRTAYCASLDPAIPIVGDLYELDYERLIRLEPTHVLLQPASATGVDPQLRRLAEERGWTIGAWTMNSVDDVNIMIAAIPGTVFDREDPRFAEAHERAGGLIIRIALALAPRQGLWQGRTLLVADTDPVWVFGQGTYLHDMLTLLGAQNAAEVTGWAELSLEDVLRLDPEAIIIVRDRGPADVDPLEAAGALAELETTARRTGRIAVLQHPDAKLPSSALSGVGEALAAVLGELAGDTSAGPP